MSVNVVDGLDKFWLVKTRKSVDGALTVQKIDAIKVSSELSAQLPGSTIEFEFLQVEATATAAVSLTSVLIGLNK